MLQGCARLIAHHIGARGFGVAFNYPAAFEKDVVHVLFEADEACAKTMQAENTKDNVFVVSCCLGRSDGEAPFYVTANPYASSNYEPSPEYASYYCEVMLSGDIDQISVQGAHYDAVYGNENRVVRTTTVRARSLDSLAAEGALPLGKLPDFLSLDTQGSEHAILIGARDTVHRSVLAIATEIEFHPMYTGQPLFSAVFDLANEWGFHFAGFTYLQEISSHRAPLGQRAKGFLAFGDAIFLRRIETLAALAPTPEGHYVLALKLAFIALNFGFVEYASQAVECALQCRVSEAFARELRAVNYVEFLQALHRATANMPQIYLNTKRADLVEQLRLNQQPTGSTTSHVASEAVPGLTPRPTRNPISILGRRVAAALPVFERRLIRPIVGPSEPHPVAAPASDAVRLAEHSPTPVEAVLADYGYLWVKDEVRRRRLAAIAFAPNGIRNA